MIDKFERVLQGRPKLSGPRALFGLRKGNAATSKQDTISELLMVAWQEEDRRWYPETQPFLFTEEFQTFVGGVMPMGIGPHRPAVIGACQRFANPDWEIFAVYMDMTYPALLWRERQPQWFRRTLSGTSQAEGSRERTGRENL